MTEKLRLLVVSFFYPPSSEPRAVQVSRLLNHSRHESLIICGADPLAPAAGVWDYQPSGRVVKVVRAGSSSRARARLGMLLTRLRRLPLAGKTPDRFSSWVGPMVKAARAYMDESVFRPHALVTFGQPWSSHMAGLRLQSGLAVPWAAHFSDPWADSPYKPMDAASRKWNQWAQDRVLGRAGRVMAPLAGLGPELFKRMPGQIGKFQALPHCFEPGVFPAAQPRPANSPRVIRFLGSFYSLRSSAPFLRGLADLQRSSPGLLKGVCFEFVGDYSESVLAEPALKGLPAGLVRAKPQVTYRQSLALMRGADALLNLEAPDISLFPSKLVDYIGAGRPILSVGPDGFSRKLVERLGGWASRPGDPGGIAAMLEAYLAQPRFPSPWGDEAVRHRYSARSIATIFDQALGDLVRGPG